MSLRSIFKAIIESVVETEPTGPITIPLQELSQIWVKRNVDAQAASSAASAAPASTDGMRASEYAAQPAFDISRYRPRAAFENLWNEYIQPNYMLFEEDGSLPAVSELIDILTTGGVCQSVVVSEKVFNKKTTMDLAKISLQNHSINVAEKLLNDIRNKYLPNKEMEYQSSIPIAIIAALGHDIGKLPSYMARPAYSKHDHPYISVDVLKKLFGKYDVHSGRLDLAIEAIKVHHEGRVSGQVEAANKYINWLQYADHKAREEELAGVRHLDAKDGAKWLDTGRLLDELMPKINIVETAGKKNEFFAFSFGGTVYASLDTLYNIAQSMYSKANIVDIVFEYSHIGMIELARKQIVRRLYEEKKLTSGLDVNAKPYGKWYTVSSSAAGNEKIQLIPIPVEKFGRLPSELELEGRKQGWLRTITAVR
ncbi:MAG: HD domain-containing protein [Syntrophales bacterium]